MLIEIKNPTIEKNYSKLEIEEMVNDFLVTIKPKRRISAKEKLTLYSMNLEDAPKSVQKAFEKDDKEEEYVSFKQIK